eukprot:COSAG06_NODE_4169_length_4504_cov_125.786606_1_plen_40_part_00
MCRWSLDPAKASLILKKFDKDKVRTHKMLDLCSMEFSSV